MKRSLLIISIIIFGLLFTGCGTQITTPVVNDLSRGDGCEGSKNGDDVSYIYETAYGFADCYYVKSECFIPTFRNWGWTTPIKVGNTGYLDLYAGAAHCSTEKGTKVGRVRLGLYNGCVTVTFQLNDGYILDEYHVYVGTTMFPQMQRGRRTVSTVAPGQYYNDCDNYSVDDDVYIIVHAVVGIPQ